MKKLLYYAPRVLGIVFILFITSFSFDVFDGTHSFRESIPAFLIRSRFSFILLAVLLVSWKNEILGGALFILVGILFLVIHVSPIVSVLPFVVGLLFLLQKLLKG